jgi:hypothetical protein
LIELVRGDPGDLLPHDLNTVVNTLDGEESLGETLSYGAVVHEVFVELSARLKLFLVDLECQMLRELGEERDEAESVVQVAQGIDERGVSVFDHRSERIPWRLLQMLLGELDFTASEELLVLFQVGLNVSEL